MILTCIFAPKKEYKADGQTDSQNVNVPNECVRIKLRQKPYSVYVLENLFRFFLQESAIRKRGRFRLHWLLLSYNTLLYVP